MIQCDLKFETRHEAVSSSRCFRCSSSLTGRGAAWRLKDGRAGTSRTIKKTTVPFHLDHLRTNRTTDAEELFYLKHHSMNFKMICLICWNVLHGHTQVSPEVQEELFFMRGFSDRAAMDRFLLYLSPSWCNVWLYVAKQPSWGQHYSAEAGNMRSTEKSFFSWHFMMSHMRSDRRNKSI